MKDHEQPAFPTSKEMCEYSDIEGYPYGLTKREYIATNVIQGLVTGLLASKDGLGNIKELCQSCLFITDVLISELNKNQKP